MENVLYKVGTWIVHPQNFSIEYDGEEVKLKSLIMKLLLLFIESDGKAISKEELLEKCWNGRVVTDDAIRQAIKELRSALNSRNDNIEYIQTIRKHGYRLLPEVELITNAQAPPFALFLQNNKKALITLIVILVIGILLTVIYQNRSYQISTDPTVITYDKKRETDYDISLEGWDAYLVIRPDYYFAESLIIRDKDKNHKHIIYPSNDDGHIENVKFSPSGKLLAYLDYSFESCRIRIIDVGTGNNVHNIDCQESDYYIALDWYSDNELFYSTSINKSQPLELRLYNIKTKEQKQLTSPAKGGRGDYFVRSCDETNSFILRNMDFLNTQVVYYNPFSEHERFIVDIPESVIAIDWLPGCQNLIIYLKEKGIFTLDTDTGELAVINNKIRKIHSLRVLKQHLYASMGRYFNISILSLDTKESSLPKVLVESRGDNRRFIRNPVTDSFAFISSRTGNDEIWLNENESNMQLTHLGKRLNEGAFAWSSDGKSILLIEESNIWKIEVSTRKVTKLKSVHSSINSLVPINESEWLYSTYENKLWQGYLWNSKTQKKKVISNLTIKTFKKNNSGDIFFRTQDDAIYKYSKDTEQYKLITSINAACSDWTIENTVIYCLDAEGLKKRNLLQNKMETVFKGVGIGQYFFLENEHKFYFEKNNSGAMDIYKYTITNSIL